MILQCFCNMEMAWANGIPGKNQDNQIDCQVSVHMMLKEESQQL